MSPHLPGSENPVTKFLRAYQDAVSNKDVDALVGLYADEVRVFDIWGVWSYDGIARWRASVTEWFASLGTERVAVRFSGVREQRAPDFAVASAFVTYSGLSASGEALRSMDNRLTWVLRSEQGVWKITHEHTSAPIDFESSKVLLGRPT